MRCLGVLPLLLCVGGAFEHGFSCLNSSETEYLRNLPENELIELATLCAVGQTRDRNDITENLRCLEGDARNILHEAINELGLVLEPENAEHDLFLFSPRVSNAGGAPKQHDIVVIDCFPYNGELIVSLRLQAVFDVVDEIVIVEAWRSYSHHHKKQQLYFDKYSDVFAPYMSKITFLPIDFRDGIRLEPAEKLLRAYPTKYIKDRWSGQRFIVHFSDADEIPSVHIMRDLREKYWTLSSPMYLRMEQFFYNFGWQKKHSVSRAFVTNNFGIDNHTLHYYRWEHHDTAPEAMFLDGGGHHFSFFMSVTDFIRKMESFSHTDLNLPVFKTRAHVCKCISCGMDILERGSDHDMITPSEATKANFPDGWLALQKELYAQQFGEGARTEGSSENESAALCGSQDEWFCLAADIPVIDCFPYNGELVVGLRLQAVFPFVDEIVIVEAWRSYSHHHRKAQLYFDKHRETFEPYMSKITFLPIDFPDGVRLEAAEQMLRSHLTYYIKDRWSGQRYIVHASDADEIPAAHVLTDIRDKYWELSPPAHLRMQQLLYNFGWQRRQHPPASAVVANNFALDHGDLFHHRLARSGAVWAEAGHHLSAFMSPEDIVGRIQSFRPLEDAGDDAPVDSGLVRKWVLAGTDGLCGGAGTELEKTSAAARAAFPPGWLNLQEQLTALQTT